MTKLFFNLLLISVLLFPVLLSAQIPVNGFCRFESYKTPGGFNNLLALNFNNDSYNDILFFDSQKKEITVSKGLENARFSLPGRTSKLRYEITQIKPFNNKTASAAADYAFISRSERIVGILRIFQSGSVSILSESKLDSYPDNLAVEDINRDGKKEIIVSGGSFYGISLISFNNGRLGEKKIFNKRIFSHLAVADLNNDTYPDIAAFDLLGTSICFLYNNSIGDFYKVRDFKLNGRINDLLSYDFNLDNIPDLIYVKDRQVNFLFGDYRAAFNNSFSVLTEKPVDDLAIGDFNRDGLLDLAYINKTVSQLSILFAKDINKFYTEISYLSKNGIIRIIPFYSKYVHGIVGLSNLGEYYLISEVNSIRDNTKIALGVKPSRISYFDAGNDGIADLCYYDRAKSSLNIIERKSDGIPSMFYSVPLLESSSDLVISDQNGRIKTFYCYSKGKRLIEVITLDFKKKKYIKDKIYSAEPVEDLKIKQEESNNRPLLYILAKQNGALRLFCYKYSNFRYTSASSGIIASNILQANINVSKELLTVFYWKRDKKGYSFNKALLNKDFNVQLSGARYVLPLKSNMQISDFAGDIFNNESSESVNIIFNNNSKFALVTSGDKCYRLDLKGSLKDLKASFSSGSQITEMRNLKSGLNDLFIFNQKSSSIEKIDVLNRQKTLLGKKIVETKDLESYFVRSLSSDKYHLVYTDKAENCIKIREISF
ncbi:MAG: FG-GAP repeat domain-containing protein [Bacillota bacterium]